MDTCGICQKSGVQLFETNQDGVFACYKCQPLVPEVTLGSDNSNEQPTQPAREITLYDQEGDTKELYCAICNKTFQKNMQLQNHLRNHRAERRFVCTYCNKAFSQSNNLRAHLRIHTNERPYKCNVCDKAFTQVTNLNNHLRLHTGERPFVCPEAGCGKAYAQVTNLNQHRKRHLSGRPVEFTYVCRHCGEQFDQRNHMYNHRRQVHGDSDGDGPAPVAPSFMCKICDEPLPSERKLASHVAAHMRAASREPIEEPTEPELKCVFSTCEARFASPAEHTQHLLSAHQLRVLTVPDHAPRTPQPRRGRPPKALKMDPLDPKENVTYEMQVKQLQDHAPQYMPKLRVQSLFQ